MQPVPIKNEKLARQLVQDELADLTLYQRLISIASGDTKRMLEELIPVERGHLEFWQQFFGKHDIKKLDFPRRVRIFILMSLCRITRERGIHLVLEAIEVNGVRKYLTVWKLYREDPLGRAARRVLEDEFRHEDTIVSETVRKRVHPERVRNFFLGFNDGLVEILGAVAGFFAAFGASHSVLIAGSTVAVAGAISMAAGAYAALSSEREAGEVEAGKRLFLDGTQESPEDAEESVFFSAFVVGISYFFGATIPMLPVVFGADTAWASILAGGIVAAGVSYVLAVISGMRASRRVMLNLVIVGIAVSVTYAIGSAARSLFGITV